MWLNLLVGAVGGLIGLSGAVIVSTLQIRAQREARTRAFAELLAGERRQQYVELLSTARRLRHVALRVFQKASHEDDHDQMINDMYRALYNIKVIAPKTTADQAQEFFNQTIEWWRLSRDRPDAPRDEWSAKQQQVKEAVQAFRALIRVEFGSLVEEDLAELQYS